MSNNKQSISFSFLPDVFAILFFVALSFAYFATPVSKGYVLTGHDHSGGAGAASEMEAYRDSHHGERTRWTNTLFSGMPTYQMAPSYPSTEKLQKVEKVYRLFLPDYVVLVFIMLLGFYILLRAFDFKAWMAALGAVLWAFSSYYFIIIGAGHIWKFYTLAYIPPTIAGMVLCYRGRYVWGFLVTAFFMSLQILSNHVQMTYYFGFVMVLMAIAFLWECGESALWRGEGLQSLRDGENSNRSEGTLTSNRREAAFPAAKQLSKWTKATLTFALGCLIGLAINASNLFHTWEYSKETMRGKSELTQQTKNPADQTDSGLERSYITAWSYGIGETWSLLIPNVKGGASQPLTQSKTAMEKANSMYMPVYQSLGQYWGEQPGTSGPVYVGAFVMFLFVLGLFIVKGPMKWALLIATILSVTLAWGKNFMPWTDFFLDYVPMYDKFRTVASILVIAEFTIPLLAMLALREIVNIGESALGHGDGLKSLRDGEKNNRSEGAFTSHRREADITAAKQLKTAALAALALTAGPCLLFWLMPDVFFGNYVSSSESAMLNNAVAQGYIPADMLVDILKNLSDMRRAVFTADAGRSLLIILVGCAVLLTYLWKNKKIRKEENKTGVPVFSIANPVVMVACLILLCTADMWDVNKRYLNDAMFSAPQPAQQFFQKTPTDEAILQDPDLYYRVANLAVSTFNDNTTSYWHKSIGGYPAAKLRRYQELIEAYIQPQLGDFYQTVVQCQGQLDSINGDSIFPVLNMLNMKYAILPLKDGETLPVQNPWSMGNAWFVDDVLLAANADEELSLLATINPRNTAVVAAKDSLPALPIREGADTSAILLTSYEANALAFDAETDRDRLAVFSDIYYPGWQCTIDGEPADILRADYVLRAVVIPAGKHKIEFRFDPKSLHTTEAIANTALIMLLVLFLALTGWEIYRRRKALAQ